MTLILAQLRLIRVADEIPPTGTSLLVGWNSQTGIPKHYAIAWVSDAGNWCGHMGPINDPPTHWAPLDCLKMD